VCDEKLLTWDELVDYIIAKQKIFFLELKSNSPLLLQAVLDKIAKHNLWPRAYLIGFAGNIKSALAAQAQYPQLRVCQLLRFPLLSFIKMPAPSWGVFIGWLDDEPGSRPFFRFLFSPARLARLVARYKARDFRVMAGVINQPEDLEYFRQAGIQDVFTDNLAHAILKP
jgi:hypothetical protein